MLQRDALGVLAGRSAAASNAVCQAGAIPPLVALLGAGPESAAATKAAGALFNLAANDTNKMAILSAGAIPPLVALLRARPDTEVAENSSGAMNNLSANLDSQVTPVTRSLLVSLIGRYISENRPLLHHHWTAIRTAARRLPDRYPTVTAGDPQVRRRPAAGGAARRGRRVRGGGERRERAEQPRV